MTKSIQFRAGEPWPSYVEPFLMITNIGRDVIHLTKQYPDESRSLCGRALRGNTYDRSADVVEEFDRALCGDCAALAKAAGGAQWL